MERCRVSIGADRLEVSVPRFSRIGAKLSRRLSQYQIPCASHIRGGERLAVVPAYAATEAKRELGHVGVPRPFRSQIRNDGIQSILRLVLLEHNQIVEYGHHRILCRVECLLMNRHAGWTIVLINSEHAPFLL